jgi:hypothetical protein
MQEVALGMERKRQRHLPKCTLLLSAGMFLVRTQYCVLWHTFTQVHVGLQVCFVCTMVVAVLWPQYFISLVFDSRMMFERIIDFEVRSYSEPLSTIAMSTGLSNGAPKLPKLHSLTTQLQESLGKFLRICGIKLRGRGRQRKPADCGTAWPIRLHEGDA